MIPEILLNSANEMAYFIVKAEKPEVLKSERAIVHYISTKDLDRSREIVKPEGMDLSEFKQAPSVWYNHGWKYDNKALPIAKNMWLRPDEHGVKAKTQFATTLFADDVYTLQVGDFIRTWSVAIAPKKDKMGKIKENSLEFDDKKNIVSWNECVLLEYSVAPIPMNIYAQDEIKSLQEMNFKSLEMGELIKYIALEVDIKSKMDLMRGDIEELKNLKALLEILIEKTETNEKDIFEISNLLQTKEYKIQKAISIELPVKNYWTEDRIKSIVNSL